MLERQWADVEVVYQAYYAYEEILATFGDAPGRSHTILAAAECVTGWVTDNEITEAVRISDTRRREVLAAYEGTGPIPALEIPERGVYISYRRDDAAYARRLYNELERELGPRRVTMDVALDPGADFVDLIERSVSSAAVVLAVIGPRWSELPSEDGRDRPEKQDFVQRELALALGSERRVVPVLVGGASFPRSHELPSGLAGLTRRQAFELSDSRWQYDLRRLVAAVELAIAGTHPQPSPLAETAYRASPSSEAVIDQVLRIRQTTQIAVAVTVALTVVSVVILVIVLLGR